MTPEFTGPKGQENVRSEFTGPKGQENVRQLVHAHARRGLLFGLRAACDKGVPSLTRVPCAAGRSALSTRMGIPPVPVGRAGLGLPGRAPACPLGNAMLGDLYLCVRALCDGEGYEA